MKKLLLSLFALALALTATAQKKDTITTASGLKYVRITPGSGASPVSGSKVKMNYTGKFTNGKVFDSNADGGPFKFTVDNKEVIKGWDEGVKLMKKGEKGILIVPGKLGYGSKGVRDPEDETKWMIPPDATLIFEVELLDVK